MGDNILVRGHTSKAFQPKYKDFCIVGLLGKNQVEIKDNHGHMTKVHHRDIKKIPMTEKVCQLYEEKQLGKTREGRKAVPANKMPHLGWDIAETQLVQENQGNNDLHMTLPLQAIITVIIMLITSLEHITTYVKEIPKFAKKTVQAVKSMITKASRNELLQNIKNSYKTAKLAIAIATNTKDRTNHSRKAHTTNGNMQSYPKHTQPMEICKAIQACENSMTSTTDRTSHTHPEPTTVATNMTSCSTVSVNGNENTQTQNSK